MLLGSPTKNGTGVLLEGDFYDLSQLYISVHRLAEYYDTQRDQAALGLLHAFAYEVRKARDGARKKKETEAGPYLGFRYVWPQVLVVAALLRQSLKWHPGQALDYAVVYGLEAQLQGALTEYDPEGSARLIYALEHGLSPAIPEAALIDGRVTLNFLQMKGGKIRFRNLATLLHEYWHPMQPAHDELKAEAEAFQARTGGSLADAQYRGWPETIRW